MKILFLCVANSARSQMAEGLARAMFSESAHVESAGSQPSGVVNPFAIEAMQEIGIDISGHFSKCYEELSEEFRAGIDFVIALCAEEMCPILIHERAAKLKWPFSDPAAISGNPADKLAAFREVCAQIQRRLIEFHGQLSTQER